LRRGRPRPEADERIQKRWFPLERVVSMIERGGIADGKTLAGVLYLQQAGKRGGSRRLRPGRERERAGSTKAHG